MTKSGTRHPHMLHLLCTSMGLTSKPSPPLNWIPWHAMACNWSLSLGRIWSQTGHSP